MLLHVQNFLKSCRVFVLVTALGQKALTGSSASEVMESVLHLVAKLLAPLLTQNTTMFGNGAGNIRVMFSFVGKIRKISSLCNINHLESR